MRRLLARIREALRKSSPRPLSRDEAMKAIDAIAVEHGLVFMLFDDQATADEFIAEMRRAHNLITKLRQSGSALPPDLFN